MEVPRSKSPMPQSPRLSPRLTEDLRLPKPAAWNEDFEQLTRSMQERMDDFLRSSSPLPQQPLPLQTTSTGGGGRGRFETQADGSVLYKVTFDILGYKPGDLKTTLIGDRTVKVSGSTNRSDPETGKQSSASFDEQFTLPDNVDPGRLKSIMASDQLTISAPVLPPQYVRASQQHQHQHQQQQQQQQQQQKSTIRQPLYTGSPRLSPRSASPAAAALHGGGVRTASAFQLEVDVGREFEPQDLTVATVDGGRRLLVHGRREVKASGKTSMREFRDEFDMPPNADAGRLTARLRSDGRVIVDIPLLRDTAGYTYWPVTVDFR